MSKKTKANSGETLVEVMASIFIFMIMMGVLQGAISYTSASLTRNQEIREENAKIIESLAAAPKSTGTTKEIWFMATTPELDTKGYDVFKVKTVLSSKTAEYQDASGTTKSTTFYLYDSTQETADSGTDTDSGEEAETP